MGGHLFETNVRVLTKDPFSILAAICRRTPVIDTKDSKIYYFDRDWWLFRHIINFLRSNVLPNELETLKELYNEASYFRIESLQKAIENVPMERIVSNVSPDLYLTWPSVNVDRFKLNR